jgi:hypothetical protein
MCKHPPVARPVVVSLADRDSVPVSDPVGELRQLAGDAVADYRANPGNAGLLREARLTLLALAGLAPDDADDPLAELRDLCREVP